MGMGVESLEVYACIDRRGITRNTRSGGWKPRSNVFCIASVCWDSLNLSLIGGSKYFQCCNGRGRQILGGTRSFNQSREGQQRVGVHQKIPATPGRRPHKLTKTENFLIMIRIRSWLPIWAQAALSTTRRVAMAHRVNHRGVPIPASPQGRPAAEAGRLPWPSESGRLDWWRVAKRLPKGNMIQ